MEYERIIDMRVTELARESWVSCHPCRSMQHLQGPVTKWELTP